MSSEALLTFLAYSTELERESQERYTELADAMATHHNAEVAAFFSRMAREAREHLAEVAALSGSEKLPTIHAWDFQWPDAEPPETTAYEAVHYRMTVREAAQLALANERAAEHFYRDYAARSDDASVRRVAGEFADEEATHACWLQQLLREEPSVSPFTREEDDPPMMPE